MASNNDYFTPEQVDDQIEQLHQTSRLHGLTDEAQLVGALQRYYRVPLSAEDRASLEHARLRITGEQSEADTLDHDLQLFNSSEVRPAARPRQLQLSRMLSGLAAAVIVGALIGSWLVVTHMVSTPIASIAGPEDLYTIHSGIVYRLDGNSGKLLWQHPVPTRKQSDPNRGGDAYLQVVNHVVYAVLDFDIYALDATSGNLIWHVTNHTNQSYFWFVVDNGRLYLFSLDNTFSALNAANGSQLWHNTTFNTQNGYGFSVQNGNLYMQNSDGNRLYTLDGATGEVRWSAPLPHGSLFSPPLVEDGAVYFSSGNTLYALKEQSGQQIWAQTVPAAGMLSGAYLADGILYANGYSVIMESSTDTRQVFALNSRTGQVLWISDPGNNTFNIPITNGLLLASRQHNGVFSIAGLDPRTGKAAWQVPFTCAIDHFGPKLAYPRCGALWTALINGKLYLLESDSQPQNGQQSQGSGILKTVYSIKSFNPATGQLLSDHPLAIGQDNAVAIGASNGLLYMQINVPHVANTIPYEDYVFAAYRLSDGVTVWRYALPPFPTPTSANTAPYTSQPVLAP
jgi:outer membrane protein assembly factor BamB